MSRALMRALSERPLEMADIVGELHRPVVDDETLLDLMGRASSEAVRLLPGVMWAGVTAQFDDIPLTIASSDQRALVLEESQSQYRAGPCMDAIRSGKRIMAHTAELRRAWPALASVAAGLGIRSFMALPLRVHNVPVGALTLYCSDENGLLTLERSVLRVLTEFLEHGLSGYVRAQPEGTAGLRLRVRRHDVNVVSYAIGMIAVLRSIEVDAAIVALHRFAAEQAVPVAEAARRFVRTHQLPGPLHD
jgi:GAF domain-containing protein